MTTMNLNQILDRVHELKQENAEKDEVIKVQQAQIFELEQKLLQMEEHAADLDEKVKSQQEQIARANELLERISEALG